MSIDDHSIEDIIDSWRRGDTTPDARDAIEQLRRDGRLTEDRYVDLAYEHYTALLDQGKRVDPRTFPELFPTYELSVRRTIEVHEWMEVWPKVGDKVLHYLLTAELGRGAKARVYQARNMRLRGRLEVVKLCPPMFEGDMSGLDEATTLARLQHDHIVQVYKMDYDYDRDLQVISMPYMGWATLVEVVDRAFVDGIPQRAEQIAEVVQDCAIRRPKASKLDGSYVDGVVDLGIQIADALQEAHQSGVYHGDVKPANVLVTPWGEAMLLDFNLSADEALQSMKIGGTLAYSAPERLQQLSELRFQQGPGPSDDDIRDLLDRRSELFSLGVILYELCTGVYPYGHIPLSKPVESEDAELIWRAEMAEQLRRRQQEPPTPVHEINRQADAELAEVINDCLAIDVGDRPSTAAEVAARLRNWKQDRRQRAALAVRERAEQQIEARIRQNARRHTRRWILAATLLMLLSAIGVGVWVRGTMQPGTPVPAPQRLVQHPEEMLENPFPWVRDILTMTEGKEREAEGRKDAIVLLLLAIEHRDDDPECHEAVAYFHMIDAPVIDRPQQRQRLERALEMASGTNPYLLNNLAYVVSLSRNGEDQAINLLHQAAAADPERKIWQIRFQLGKSGLNSNARIAPDDAAHHMREALESIPETQRSWRLLRVAARVFLQTGHDEDARLVFEEMIARGVRRDAQVERALNGAVDLPWYREVQDRMEAGENVPAAGVEELVRPPALSPSQGSEAKVQPAPTLASHQLEVTTDARSR